MDPEAAAARKVRNANQFIVALPHSRDLGMVVLEIGDGVAVMALDYDARLIGDPETGVLHGGVVTALLDTCCGTARDDASLGADQHGDHRPAHRLYAAGGAGAAPARAGGVFPGDPNRGFRARLRLYRPAGGAGRRRGRRLHRGTRGNVMARDLKTRGPIEPVQVLKQRRDAALARLVAGVPYIRHLGVELRPARRRADRAAAPMTRS